MTTHNNVAILQDFFDRVWNTGSVTDVPQFIAPTYIIHSDPGDPWDGQTLTQAQFCERLQTSHAPFPDLAFTWDEVIDAAGCVVVSWTLRGTHSKPLGDFPATGRTIAVKGMTVYYFTMGKLTGHRQVVDRLAVLQQLGVLG